MQEINRGEGFFFIYISKHLFMKGKFELKEFFFYPFGNFTFEQTISKPINFKQN